jgi:hypothetical protein
MLGKERRCTSKVAVGEASRRDYVDGRTVSLPVPGLVTAGSGTVGTRLEGWRLLTSAHKWWPERCERGRYGALALSLTQGDE